MPDNNNHHVGSQDYSITQQEAENHQIPQTKTLYYSQKDPETGNARNLYLTEADAITKTIEAESHYFPMDILDMYIFGFITDGQGNYNRRVFKIVNTRDYTPTHKQVKLVSDLIDYIHLYRPTNGIKWYLISREEFSERIGILNQYWRMGFPDKTGEFRYSKRVNKWLATNELGSLLEDGCIEIEFEDLVATVASSQFSGQPKTLLQLINERIQNIFEGIGTLFEGFFSGDWFKKSAFNSFWQSITKDGNGNWTSSDLNDVFKLDFSKLGINKDNRNIKQWFDDSIASIKTKFDGQSSGSGIFASIWNDHVLPWIRDTLKWNWWD